MTDVVARLGAALENRYIIERELGHGGMATVYLARDLKHRRTVAIKVLKPELTEAVGAERFLREIEIAAQLQHPHILPLIESGEAAGLLYYVMPFVEGESLRDRLARGGALPVSDATRLLRDIVDGIAHAHRHGVVHRDIKPDNVMIAERHALVVDFGVAKAMREAAAADAALTSVGMSLGTPAYMAPEQAAADPAIDHRADIYSVGIVGYEMLAGRPPFTGTPQSMLAAHVSVKPTELSVLKTDVPPALAKIVMRCLEKDPEARYATADDLLADIEALSTPQHTASMHATPRRRWQRRGALLGAVVAVIAGGWVATSGMRRDRWLHATALPELRRLVEAAEQDSAFALAAEIDRVAPGDSTVEALRTRFARRAMLTTEPPGVTIYRASLADTSEWMLVGTTPMDSALLPMRVGLFRFEKAGYRSLLRLHGSVSSRTLLETTSAPHGEMVRVTGGLTRPFLVGTDGAEALELSDFAIDRFETSNREFRAFVDGGGYAKREYWEHEFRDGAATVTWEQAMAKFVDRTGRPGPATWEGGSYAHGADSLPVGGVSWYEAAAYAKFVGKSLPTLYHWARASNAGYSRWIVPVSNLAGDRPWPVGTPRAVSASGTSDMAGNVREWCSNEAGAGLRFILGGGWSDPQYGYVDAYAMTPMNRAPINGIRLAKYASDDKTLARAMIPIPRAFTDYSKAMPASDAVFAGLRQVFDYDPTPLNAAVESRDTTDANWIVERVSFATAYGERMSAWIWTPRNAKRPLQTVVFFPGSGVINGGPSPGTAPQTAGWVVGSGRAFVLPIYKSTHERTDSLRSDVANGSIFWRDHVVMWVKDFRRTLDYLATRPELDSTKIGYFGFSWGGYMGGIIPAIEPRIKASVLYVAGLTMEQGRPEVEPFNYLPRVKVPTLMLNGRHDFFFPVETAQQPFFRTLGTSAEHKKYKVYEGGHDVPRTELISESLKWMDRYLGPTK